MERPDLLDLRQGGRAVERGLLGWARRGHSWVGTRRLAVDLKVVREVGHASAERLLLRDSHLGSSNSTVTACSRGASATLRNRPPWLLSPTGPAIRCLSNSIASSRFCASVSAIAVIPALPRTGQKTFSRKAWGGRSRRFDTRGSTSRVRCTYKPVAWLRSFAPGQYACTIPNGPPLAASR